MYVCMIVGMYPNTAYALFVLYKWDVTECIYIYIYTYIHTYLHTYIHTHAHTYIACDAFVLNKMYACMDPNLTHAYMKPVWILT